MWNSSSPGLVAGLLRLQSEIELAIIAFHGTVVHAVILAWTLEAVRWFRCSIATWEDSTGYRDAGGSILCANKDFKVA